MKTQVSIVIAALAGLAVTTVAADAQTYHRSYHRHYYSKFTGRNPNYMRGMGMHKQTSTGGPVGGSTNSMGN